MSSLLVDRLRERAMDPPGATDMATARHPAKVFPPAAGADLAAAESRLGFALPELLRRIFTEVASGGFGPGYGLLGLPGGATDDRGLDCVSAYESKRHRDTFDPHWHWPDALLPLGHLGCAMYACVDCTTDAGAVVWFEPNPHTPGQPWDDSFIPLASSLESWLTAWLDGTEDALYDSAWASKFPEEPL